MNILYADDDADDREIFCEAIKEINPAIKVVLGKDGEETLKILSVQKELPQVIFLDINMPKMDGKQTFLAIKQDRELQNIPVTIFSTSSSETESSFFRKYDTPYFVKPVKEKELSRIAADILKYCSHHHELNSN